jgi:hypothetical protein
MAYFAYMFNVGFDRFSRVSAVYLNTCKPQKAYLNGGQNKTCTKP